MKWDGKTKGYALGYQFFFFLIKHLGLNIAYVFCFFVASIYTFLLRKQKKAVVQFQKKSFGHGTIVANYKAWKTFYNYATTLVDKFAIAIKWRKKYKFNITNDSYIKQLLKDGNGGILISGHLGNGEIAGSLISEMITSNINVLFYNNEAQNIQDLIKDKTGGASFNIIEIKQDLSHLIKIKNAASNNELIALHADRMLGNEKFVEMEMFGNKAKFPVGPFIMGTKFKIPCLFVFGVKTGYRTYSVEAIKPSSPDLDGESLCREFAIHYIDRVSKYPEQFYNFYDFYAD